MIVRAVRCKHCKDTIYSRARHDFRFCTCGKVFIDGGFEYIRIGGDIEAPLIEVEVDATQKELYDDWNSRKDKFGLIKGE